MQMNASCFHSAIQERDAEGCRNMASSANVLTHSALYSIIFSKQESIFRCRLIISRHPGSRSGDSQVTSLCANSANKIHFQKVKSPQIFACGSQVQPHVEDTHTRMWTHWADWQPVAPQREVGQRTSWLSAGTQAEVIDKPLSCETTDTFESQTDTMPEKRSSELFS